MPHTVQFTPKRGPSRGKRVKFTAKGPAPRRKDQIKVGFCKKVRNPRTGKTVELCKVKARGKRSWKFRKLRGRR